MKYLVYLLTITIVLFHTTANVHAESSSTSTDQTNTTTTAVKVAPLKTLDTVGRLAQSLGLNSEEVQAEIDSGKTLEQIAADHGMPVSYYRSRVLQANFKPLTTVKTPIKKTITTKKTTKVVKAVKIVKPVVTKVVKPVVPVKKAPVNKKAKQ